MKKITPQTMAQAIKRSFERKCRVRRIDDSQIEVRCPNLDHTRHVVSFERTPTGELRAECALPEQAEMCPAELGRMPCYHITSALPLFLLVEARRALSASQQTPRQATRRTRNVRREREDKPQAAEAADSSHSVIFRSSARGEHVNGIRI